MLLYKKAILGLGSTLVVAEILPIPDPYWNSIKEGGIGVIIAAMFIVVMRFVLVILNRHEDFVKAQAKENASAHASQHAEVVRIADASVKAQESLAVKMETNNGKLDANTSAIDRLSQVVAETIRSRQ